MSNVQIYTVAEDLKSLLELEKAKGGSIGFVPTMGALHDGHLSLVKRCKDENSLCVVSIYVNPRQFNESDDFANYPRQIEVDREKLETLGGLVLFLPTSEDLFNVNFASPKVDLMGLDQRLEGASRPGHFQGVMDVVYALFNLVHPSKAYFGLKDFQQVAVVQNMVGKLSLPVEIVPVPTLREASGLAMSSRNQLLSLSQQEEATLLYKTLCFVRDNIKSIPLSHILASAQELFSASLLQLDYLVVVEPTTLLPLTEYQENAHCCIAAYLGKVRLIDNMAL